MHSTKVDTLELIKRYRQGEKELLDFIVKENQSLAYSLVNRYKVSKKEEKEDLNQVALIGLIKAIDNFDFSYDVSFSTYAVPIILGEIKKHFRDSSLLKVSRNLKDLYYKIEKEKSLYLKENGKEITLDELERSLNIDRYELVLALESNISPLSIEKEYENEKDGGFSLENIISAKKEDKLLDLLTELLVSDDDSGDTLREALNQIEKFILIIKNKYRDFLINKELNEISNKLKLIRKNA